MKESGVYIECVHFSLLFLAPIFSLLNLCWYRYQGLPPPILGAAAENATLFLTYNNLKRALAAYDPAAVERASGGTPLTHTLIAAAGGGAVTSFVL